MPISKKLIAFIFPIILFQCSEKSISSKIKLHGDILITNGTIYDGINEPILSNVLTSGDSIIYIGPAAAGLTADSIIDAQDKIVAPGFIDAHAHGDPIKNGLFNNFINMGVTTIVLGQDGASPKAGELMKWFDQVDSIKPGVNIAMLIGHATLRKESGIGYQKNPTEEDIDEMVGLLDKALNLGCFGMSSGIEYHPGVFASQKELEETAKKVGQYNGIIMSHIRNEDDDQVISSIDELLSQNKYANVHVSHIKSVFGKGSDRGKEIINYLYQSKSKSKFTVSADVYPYLASYTEIGIVFPKWVKNPYNYEAVAKSRRDELLKFIREKVNKRNGPESTLFGNGKYKGMTLKEVSQKEGMPFENVLVDLIGPYGASGAYFVMDEELQSEFIVHPDIIISSDGSPSMHHPRGYGSFAKMIAKYVIQDTKLSLKEAISKMTYLSAKTIGIPDRGVLAVGKKADILIFNPNDIKDEANFENPHLFAKGFDTVIINGKLSKHKLIISGERFGKILKKRALN